MRFTRTRFQLKYFIFQWLWLIILLPKPVQLLVFSAVIMILISRKKYYIKKDPIAIAMILLFCVHFFSVIYNIAFLQTGSGREMAAFNTMLLWLVAALYVSYYKNETLDMVRIGRSCVFNLFVTFIYSIIAFVMYYVVHIKGFDLLGNALYAIVYLNGLETIRFFGFNDFSNMNLIYIMINFMAAVPYLNEKKKEYADYSGAYVSV